jgi:hypothetical protein
MASIAAVRTVATPFDDIAVATFFKVEKFSLEKFFLFGFTFLLSFGVLLFL